MDNITSVWIAPVITGLIVWLITKILGRYLFDGKDRNNANSAPSAKSIRVKNGEIPPGYYRYNAKTARLMDSRNYLGLTRYLEYQTMSIWWVSFVVLICFLFGYFDNVEYRKAIAVWACFNLVALFPWTVIFRKKF